MTYLKVYDYDEQPFIKARQSQSVARALRAYAEVTGRWQMAQPMSGKYLRGQCRQKCEYDTVYLRINDVHLATYLAGMGEFQGRWRREDTVRVFEAV